MSGPKSSRYTLTSEQRKILAEQRKLERRKSVALEKIKRNNKRLLQISSMCSSGKEFSDELQNRYGNDGGFACKLLELKNVIAPITQIISKTNNDDVTSLENTSKEMATILVKAEKLASEIALISAKNEITLHDSLGADIDKGFSTSFAEIQNISHEATNESKSKIVSQLIETKNNQNLPKELICELDATLSKTNSIDDETFLKNYSSVTVYPLLKRCRQYLNEYETCHEEFETLYSEYTALCDLYFYVPQKYPCCNDSIKLLKSEIKRIKDTADADDEQSYISGCLDEVMEEMGYTVIGSREVTKKNGKHFCNELYTYGKGTAVNVTYSSDGKIAMELGVNDATDIKKILDDQKNTDFIAHIHSKYPKEKIMELLSMFSDRRKDNQIRKEVNDAATVPTIYEYIIGIAWYYISNQEFDLYSSLNLTLNADFEPVIHAGGGDGDIVINYEEIVIMLEVTLMNKHAQKRGEWEPVLRHSLNLKAASESKETITFFIADELDYNTINIWRAVASVSLESTNTHTKVDGVVIMPFTNDEVLAFLQNSIYYKDIVKVVKDSFTKVPQITDVKWHEEILSNLIS